MPPCQNECVCKARLEIRSPRRQVGLLALRKPHAEMADGSGEVPLLPRNDAQSLHGHRSISRRGGTVEHSQGPRSGLDGTRHGESEQLLSHRRHAALDHWTMLARAVLSRDGRKRG